MIRILKVYLLFLTVLLPVFLYGKGYRLRGDIFFVNKDWCMFSLGKYQLVQKGDLLNVYRNKSLIGKIEVREPHNLYSKAKIVELNTFYLKEGDIVEKVISDANYFRFSMLELNLNRLKLLQENLKTLLQNKYPAMELKDLAQFSEWYFLQHGVIFDLKKGMAIKEVVHKWKNDYSPKSPLFFLFRKPSSAAKFIVYNNISYDYWKKEIDKFLAYRKKIKFKNLQALERKIFNLRRERDIKLNPTYQTFVKYYGKPDKVIREVMRLDFIKETCYWYDAGIWAEFINKKLLKREKFKGVKR